MPEDEINRAESGAPGFVLVLNWHVRSPGGVSQVVSSIAPELARLGWAPAILVNDWKARSPQTDYSLTPPVVSWRVRAPWEASSPLRNFIAYLAGLPLRARTWLRLARDRRWHVVNCHFPDSSAAFWLLLRASGIWKGVVVISVHGSDVRTALISKDRIGKFLLRRVLIGADAIVACAAGLAADVVTLAPEVRDRIQVIHNGVDFEALAAHVTPEFVLPPELSSAPFILNVATYEPKKSQQALIQAFSITAARHDHVHLVIIGRQTPWFETIRACAAQSGFSERIHLLVDLPHGAVMNWLSRAAVFCLPSESEGHPLVIMEAAAFAIPVVATSIEGITDIITGADEGLLVPVSAPEALAGALNRMIERPQAAADLGRNLRRSVGSRYSWARTARQYSDLGRSLLDRRNHPDDRRRVAVTD